MSSLFSFHYSLDEIPYVLFAIVIGFTIHEFSHAYVAYRFGDPTARNEGRITFNPLAHLDPIGTILFLIAGFGWARPVPVNRFYFKNPRLAGVLTTLAGPVSNLVVAFVALSIWHALSFFGLLNSLSDPAYSIWENLVGYTVSLNVWLFVFNLIPFPPLDGYRIIEDLVSNHTRAKMSQYEHVGKIIFIILLITPLGGPIFNPIFGTFVPTIIQAFHTVLSLVWPY